MRDVFERLLVVGVLLTIAVLVVLLAFMAPQHAANRTCKAAGLTLGGRMLGGAVVCYVVVEGKTYMVEP